MREILYRGKRLDNDEWVEGDLVHNGFLILIYKLPEETKYMTVTYIIDPETIGQYTGLTDKNGKKIFEGDIVKFHTETYTSMRDTIGVVKYYNASYGIAYKNKQHFLAFNNASTNVRWYEIIGNIYDNPELLEAKNEN